MRKSRVLRKLRSGKAVSCFKSNFSDVSVVEIAAMAGFDCIWTDMEHVPNDWSVIKHQVLAAKTGDADIMARVSRGSYSDYIKPLEADASGIMVPHVMGLDDAREIVRITRFHPLGRRALDGGNADGAYCRAGLNEYIKHANNEKFVVLQIEDPEPLDELEEMAGLEGVDILFFGAQDFTQRLCIPGQRNHPEVRAVMKRIVKTADKYGKYAGAVANEENLQEVIDMGYKFIKIGSDVKGLSSHCDAAMEVFCKLT